MANKCFYIINQRLLVFDDFLKKKVVLLQKSNKSGRNFDSSMGLFLIPSV